MSSFSSKSSSAEKRDDLPASCDTDNTSVPAQGHRQELEWDVVTAQVGITGSGSNGITRQVHRNTHYTNRVSGGYPFRIHLIHGQPPDLLGRRVKNFTLPLRISETNYLKSFG